MNESIAWGVVFLGIGLGCIYGAPIGWCVIGGGFIVCGAISGMLRYLDGRKDKP